MADMIKRDIEETIIKWLDSRHILAIRGTRQCGKTTFLKRLAEILQETGVAKNEIHFISFEDDIELEKFEKDPKEYIHYHLGGVSRKQFFLLDEVQYIKNAGKLLKLVYDEIENIKIIVTGSSTLDLNEIGSYLVGRVLLFEMYPFSFSEYLMAQDPKIFRYHNEKRIDLRRPTIRPGEILLLKELNDHLHKYLTYGGYPAIVLETDPEKKKTLLRNLFLTYIEKDIVKIYGTRYRQRVSDLIRQLASINAGIINYNELSGLTGLYDKEVKEILSILEDTYVIKLIRPFHKNLTTELKKNPKVYFIDTGLRNSITGRYEFSEEEHGRLLENYVMGKLRDGKTNYWRTTSKAEVDFVYAETIPIEIKSYPKITRSFRSFIESYKPPFAILANLTTYSKTQVESTDVFLIPLALL